MVELSSELRVRYGDEITTTVSARCRSAERGASRLTLTVFGAIGAAVVWTVYTVVPFFYGYFELQNQMAAIITVADDLKDDVIRKRLTKVIVDLGIPAEPKDLVIDRRDRRMKISLAYQEVLSLRWNDRYYDLYTFHFHPEAEGRF